MRVKSKNGRFISTAEEIFGRHVRRSDGCWLWAGYRNTKGYGFTRIGGRGSKAVLAARLSWQLHKGPIPLGLHVLHRCDVPACVNPSHLFLGTNADNIADRVAKGRSYYGPRRWGDNHPNSKITEAQVREIIERRKNGETRKSLALEYGITGEHLSRIIARTARRFAC